MHRWRSISPDSPASGGTRHGADAAGPHQRTPALPRAVIAWRPTGTGVERALSRQSRNGSRAISPKYSDLNAMLLGLLVEAVTGESLDEYARREVFAPLKLSSTGFMPAITTGLSLAPSFSERGRPVSGGLTTTNAYCWAVLPGMRDSSRPEATWPVLPRPGSAGQRRVDGPGSRRPRYRSFCGARPGAAAGLWAGTLRSRGCGFRRSTASWQARDLRSQRLDRHDALDRSRPRPVPGVPHQSESRARARRSITALHSLRATLSDLVIRLAQR